jgi:hypothetical protein
VNLPPEILYVSGEKISPVFSVAWTTREEFISQDPFRGNGVWLEYPGLISPEDLADIILEVFGRPCAATDCGAWMDLTGTVIKPDHARRRWAAFMAAEGPGRAAAPD